MAVPASEYRERLLAKGCDEGQADAILSLVEIAPNDAAAELVMQAGEQAACSEQMVIERLNAQLSRNKEQYRAVNSVLSEIARAVREQSWQGIAGINRGLSQFALAVAEVQAKNAEQQQVENERLHAEVLAACDRWQLENEQRYAKQIAANEQRYAEQMAANEQRHAERMAASEQRHAERMAALAE